jgi:hypothetical protein
MTQNPTNEINEALDHLDREDLLKIVKGLLASGLR